ncbi:predicted protein [Histoplasma capsulatum G186AR]|uniref:Uncharacterized protein n=1 Tax=Ajellomyces capsulatus (strain G186AR / H82 / ATCC MYA-2454 / RMSCC 2432) TaxID=447093 RepID=C0NNQ3_AJECG|nr:uncharacterized protein HCBG_04783 [Histoplasma capsulatum G186AR]EEH06563.1 predicted protein [Histoplasma capsulatum G186AR]
MMKSIKISSTLDPRILTKIRSKSFIPTIGAVPGDPGCQRCENKGFMMPSRTYSHLRKIDESQGGSGRRFIFAFETCNTDIEPVRDTMTFIDGKEGGIRESNGI